MQKLPCPVLLTSATATTQSRLVQRFREPDAPEPRAGAFDTEIVVVDEKELVRRQHSHSLQVAIQLRCIVCRELERRPGPAVQVRRRDSQAVVQAHTVDLRGSGDPLQYEQAIEAYGGCLADFDVRQLDLPRRLVALKACRLVQGIEKLRGDSTSQGVELPNAHVAAELERPRVRMGERTLEYGIEPALIRRCRKRLEAAIDPAAQGDRR